MAHTPRPRRLPEPKHRFPRCAFGQGKQAHAGILQLYLLEAIRRLSVCRWRPRL